MIRARTVNRSPAAQISAAAGAGIIVLCLFCAMCSGVLQAIGSANHDTRGAVVITPALTPHDATETPAPGAPPKATSTPKLSPTATNPPSPEQVLTTLLKSALQHDRGHTDGLKVGYEIGDENLDVTLNAQDNLTDDLTRFGIKQDAMSVFRAIYTQWPASLGAKPQQVTSHDMGKTVDKYGNEGTGAWGTAILYRETAAKFNWNNLTGDQLWNLYDIKYFISGL